MDSLKEKVEIIVNLYNQFDYKSIKSIFDKVNRNYYWLNIYKDIKKFIKSCDYY